MFQNPIMLAGLGGVMAPVVIHLLSRARYRSVEWGAMMFLESPAENREQAGRLREMALLGLRMAIVALLAMALARPVAGRLGGAAGESGRVTAAIIVDCSGSMAHEDGGVSRMAEARTAVLRVLSGLRRGDQVCLIPAGGANRADALFTGDLQAVANHVSELKPAAASADFEDSIAWAVDALEREQGGEKRLYLVCDHQAASWASVDEDAAAQCKRRLSEIGATFAVIAVGSDASENISIDAVSVVNPPIVAGNAAQLEVRLHNYGEFERLGVPITVRLDERDEQSSTANLPPGQGVNVLLPIKFATAGPHVVNVVMRGDGGDVDDHRQVLIDVADPIRTLIIRQADPAGTDYLRAAISPYASSGQKGTDLAKVEIALADEWDESSLSQYKVVILDDFATFSASQARAIEQFVYAGGGLIVAPGPTAQTSDYNRLLYREESALLPALLRPAETPAKPLHVDSASIDTSHPLTRFLVGNTAVANVTVDRYFPVTGRSAGARVLASLSNGNPMLIESPYGSGRISLWTAGLDARWSSLPVTNLYLPLVQSMLRFVSGTNSTQHNVTAGQEIVATFAGMTNHSSRAVIVRPDGSRDQADVTDLEDRAEVRYSNTQLAGIYTIRAGSRGHEQVQRFAATPSAVESDLSPLSSARWTDLGKGFGFTRVNDVRKLGATGGGELAGGEYWLALIVVVIGLLVLEMAMTGAWWKSPRFNRLLQATGGRR